MVHLFLVMLGGAVGSGARYGVGRASLALLGPGYPWGTFAVNLVGGLAMGLLAGTISRFASGEEWRLLLGVGLLGGFTTFSAFSLELALMLQRGATMSAGIYATASVVGSVAALFLGLTLARGVA
jgi:CrcB protein